MDNIHSIHNIDTLYHINTLNHINYISKDYWNNRYNNTSNNYDWYLKPKHLIKLFNNIIHPHYKIFILGYEKFTFRMCTTSNSILHLAG